MRLILVLLPLFTKTVPSDYFSEMVHLTLKQRNRVNGKWLHVLSVKLNLCATVNNMRTLPCNELVFVQNVIVVMITGQSSP